MRGGGIGRHERRWASDTVPDNMISGSSSPSFTDTSSINYNDQEFVEVTLDLQDDDTIVLRSVEPATVINVDTDLGLGLETPASSRSRSPTMRRSSSSRLRQFSPELKAEAVAKARQFSMELRRFPWSIGHASRASSSSTMQNVSGGLDSALAARAMRKQRAQLDRTRSGAHKALKGLRFISNSKINGVDGWNEVLDNFNKLAKDGFLYRSDFAQCIGLYLFLYILL